MFQDECDAERAAERAAIAAERNAERAAERAAIAAERDAERAAERAAIATERAAERAVIAAERDAERAAIAAERDTERAATAAERAAIAANFEVIFRALDGDEDALVAIRMRNILVRSETKIVRCLQLPVPKNSGSDAASLQWRNFVQSLPVGDEFAHETALIREKIAAGVAGASDLRVLLPTPESAEPGPQTQKALHILLMSGNIIQDVVNLAAQMDLDYSRYKEAIRVIYEDPEDAGDAREGFEYLLQFG
ncbi:hypothetical protein BD779DRAFT_1479226 [Infundibulicybe gibba]|nr:hypothetical protein BD779DRAFT_1479226 [Infundibulicybe gibba]